MTGGAWVASALDSWRALRALVRTTLLFRLGGRRAVARATLAAVVPTARPDALPVDEATVWRAYRAVRRAKRLWPFSVRCLQTALVLREVLTRRGLPAAVCLGVRLHNGKLEGHAWVEVGGWALDDARIWQTFAALPVEQLRTKQVIA
jgi:hypothetical protein